MGRATCARWPARGCAPSGPGTASRLTRFGLKVDLIPEDHSADGVVAALKATGPLKGKRVLFPKADIARDTLPEELRAAGAEVTEVVAYRTVTAESDAHLGIYRQLLDRRIDAVTFSSASAVRAFVVDPRRRSGGRSAEPHARRDDRPGHGRRGAPLRHHAADHAGQLHDAGARRRAGRALPRRRAASMTARAR